MSFNAKLNRALESQRSSGCDKVDRAIIRRSISCNAQRMMEDALKVLEWVYYGGPDVVPPKMHDLSARALDRPSLAHGFADDGESDV